MIAAKVEFFLGEGDRWVIEMEAPDEAIPSPGDFTLLHRAEDIGGRECDAISDTVYDHQLTFRFVHELEEDIVSVKVTNEYQVL